MGRYVFQDAAERLVEALDDAFILYDEAVAACHRRTGTKKSGVGGGLYVESRAMYRAIAVQAVAAWEDFNEQLVAAGLDYKARTHRGTMPPLRSWWKPESLSSPTSTNVRKLYWQFFALDPVGWWEFSFGARASDVGDKGRWWRPFCDTADDPRFCRTGEDAARWLDCLVKLRHATAHRDMKHYGKAPEIGVASKAGHAWGVGQHHAENAIAVVTQLALCTIRALAEALDVPGVLRCSATLSRWELAGVGIAELPQWAGIAA